MLTSLLRKSTPLNYTLIILMTLMFFFVYNINSETADEDMLTDVAGGLTVIFASLFMVNFILKKNGLTRDSSYAIFFFLLFMLFFAPVFNNLTLLISNFFILLALRRLISLHSPKSTREKIFDASLWIFAASMFQFWAITYILLVFISILFHVSRDYRNWILPFLAFFCVAAVFALYAMAFDANAYVALRERSQIDYSIDYFTNRDQNLALSIYASIALFFTVSMFLTMTNRPMQLQSSIKKLIASFFIGVFIYIVSPLKSNDLLIFTFAPLAYMGASFMEYYYQDKIKQEVVLWLTAASSIFLFILQL